MAEKKEDKKQKKVYFSCQYCNRGLRSKQGLAEHEKACLLNPANQQPKFESSEMAEKITPEMEDKIKEKINSNNLLTQKFILDGLESKQEQIREENRKFTPDERNKFDEVLDFVKKQKESKEEIEQDKLTAEKIKGKSKIMNAVSELENLKSGEKMGLQEALAYSIIQDTLQSKQLNQIYMQERLKQLNQPAESSKSDKFQEQVLGILLKNLVEAKNEDDISKFEKNYTAIKGMIDLVGEKSPATEGFQVMGEVAKAYAPIVKEIFDKKQKNSTQKITNIQYPTPEMPVGAPIEAPNQENPNVLEVIHNQKQEEMLPLASEPTDKQLMQMNFLHDENYPNDFIYPFSSYTDFKNKPKQTPMA